MKKVIAILLATVLTVFGVFAQDDNNDAEKKSLFSLALQTDFAYHPKAEFITGDTHYAPITGVYDGVEACTTLTAAYKLNTPLGEHWLVSDANVTFRGALELTPISLKQKLSIEFTPVPFLIFSAGGSIGWGWNIGPIEGLCEMNKATYEYEPISTISHPYYEAWGTVTFQFDTGALIPGDWSHVVLLASYTTIYFGIAGLESDSLYEWQCSKYQVRGLAYQAQCILGYQMPLPINLAGVMFKATGYYNGDAYGVYNDVFDGDFPEISISPLVQFKIGKKDNLICLFDFSSRRSFENKIEKESDILNTKVTGREWYFKRFAISWTHTFM